MDKTRGKPPAFSLQPSAFSLILCCGLVIILARSEEGQPQKKESQPEKKESQPEKKESQPEKKEGQAGKKDGEPEAQSPAQSEAVPGDVIAVAPPPFSAGIFPCSGCHEDLELSPIPHKMTKRHKEIVLNHGPTDRWCLDCHTLNNIDKLHLASGKLIDFTESYKLCGQCHGPTLRDWKAGEHGKRSGSWSGKKEYLLCASCHNPHSPKFQPLKPLPPPVRPKDLR